KTVVPSTLAMIEVGRRLRDAKEALRGGKHGSFGIWLKTECAGLSERTAERYMAAAMLANKTDTVSVLPPRALQCLAARGTPEEAREEVITKLKDGETLSSSDAREIIQRSKRKLEPENLSDAREGSPPTKATTSALTDEACDFEITDADEQ